MPSGPRLVGRGTRRPEEGSQGKVAWPATARDVTCLQYGTLPEPVRDETQNPRLHGAALNRRECVQT